MKQDEVSLSAGQLAGLSLKSSSTPPTSLTKFGELSASPYGAMYVSSGSGEEENQWSEIPETSAERAFATSILSKLRHWWPLGQRVDGYYQDLHGGTEMRAFTTGAPVDGEPGLRVDNAAPSTRFTSGAGAFIHGKPTWLTTNLDVHYTAFVKLNTSTAGSRILIADAPGIDTGGTANNQGAWFWLIKGPSTSYHIRSTWEYGSGGLNVNVDSTVNDVAVNAATHVSYGRDSVAKNIQFYVNGQQSGLPVNYSTNPGLAFGAVCKFSIGDEQNATTSDVLTSNNTNPFNGWVQDVAAFDQVLSPSELSFLYNGGRGFDYGDLYRIANIPYLWTPAQLSRKVVWAKGDHKDNVTSSGYVSQIENLTGFRPGLPYNSENARRFRNDITTLNGRKVLTASSANNRGHFVFGNTNNNRFQSVAGITMIMVHRPYDVADTTYGRIVQLLATASASLVQIEQISGRYVSGARRLAADTYMSAQSAVISGWSIVAVIADYTTGIVTNRFNGVNTTTSGLTTGVTSATQPSSGISFGGTATNTNDVSSNHELAELLVFDRLLTQQELELIEGYLADQWGLRSILPSDHQYKNAAPLVL